MVENKILENKIYDINDLFNIIKKKNLKLDIIEINPKITPSIVKVENLNKFKYKLKKKLKKFKNVKNNNIKIIRLSPQINKHDTDFKIKNAIKFLKKRYKVKFYVFFKGRSIIYKYQGKQQLIKYSEKLKKYGYIQKLPFMDKNKMYMIVYPLNKNKNIIKNEKKIKKKIKYEKKI